MLAALALSVSDCVATADDSQRMRCAMADLATAEDALNFAWVRAIDTARSNDQNPRAEKWSPSRESRARAAHVAWLAYRDAQCTAEYLAPVARSLEDVNRLWCRTRLTKERTAELNLHFIVD